MIFITGYVYYYILTFDSVVDLETSWSVLSVNEEIDTVNGPESFSRCLVKGRRAVESELE